MISPTRFYRDRIADYRDYRRKALVSLAVPGGTWTVLAMIPGAEGSWALKALLAATVLGALATGWTSAEVFKCEWKLAQVSGQRRRRRAKA